MSSCMTPGYSCEWCRKKRRSCTAHEQLSDIQKLIDTELRSKDLRTILFGAEEQQLNERLSLASALHPDKEAELEALADSIVESLEK
ncbi:MAG: hypothetical protein ACI4OO_01475 [Otoolea sp.]